MLICFMSDFALSTSAPFGLSLVSLGELDGRRGDLRRHKRRNMSEPAAARGEIHIAKKGYVRKTVAIIF